MGNVWLGFRTARNLEGPEAKSNQAINRSKIAANCQGAIRTSMQLAKH